MIDLKNLTIMDEVKLQLDDRNHGAFTISDDEGQLGEMVISVAGPNLTVYHTEVSEKAEGKGYAKKMLESMVDYARTKSLKVIPLCPYVHAQFKRHPDEYADVWNKEREGA